MSDDVSDILGRVSSESSDSVYPPVWIAACSLGSVFISAVLIFFGPSWLHWFGYVMGTLVTTAVVLLYRHRTLKVSSHPRFVRKEQWNRATAGALLAGMIAGGLNVYQALTEVRIK